MLPSGERLGPPRAAPRSSGGRPAPRGAARRALRSSAAPPRVANIQVGDAVGLVLEALLQPLVVLFQNVVVLAGLGEIALGAHESLIVGLQLRAERLVLLGSPRARSASL